MQAVEFRAISRRDRSDEGFTLLEIVVAAAILAMVMTMSYDLFRWIREASARVTEGRPRDRAVRVVLDRIERELSGAILLRRPAGIDPLAHPWIFYAEDSTFEEHDADRVRFVTQTPLRVAGEPIGRGVRIVTYGVQAESDGLPILVRTESALGDKLDKHIDLSDAQVVAEDVVEFSLRYIGESGPRDTWDSSSVETDSLLPLNIEVLVQLWQHDARGELVAGPPVKRLMEIPTRPEFLDPPDVGIGGCPTGIATAYCRVKWFTVLAKTDSRDDPSIATIRSLFGQLMDPCWASEQPADQRQQLATLLRTIGANVPECPP